MKLSLHTHVDTPYTGSTLENLFIKRVDMGHTHFAYTDISYFSGALRAYDMCLKRGVKPILGVEALFKDRTCSLTNTKASGASRFFKTTLYAPTENAYRGLGYLTSNPPETTQFFGDSHPLWNWEFLKKAASVGCIIGTSDIHDIVSKNFVLGDPETAEKVFLKIKSLFGENMYSTIIGVNQSKRYDEFVSIKLSNGTSLFLQASEKVTTNAARSVAASEVFQKPNKHFKIISSSSGGVLTSHDSEVREVKFKRGYIPFKDGDLQGKANKGITDLAKRHGITILYSDYAYYADKDDKVVQDVKLSSDGKKEYADRHIQTKIEAFSYLSALGMNELEIDQLFENQDTFAKRFDDFKLNFEYRLPTPDGDSMEIVARTIREAGRLPIDNPKYVQRLRDELDVIANNGKINLLPYFIPLLELNKFVTEKGTLIGPGRGSSGGSLLCYLLGITHIDPIRFGLSFERFLSMDRVLASNIPDIDIDYSSRRHISQADGSGFLDIKYGKKYSQISTKSLLRLKSSIKDVNRYIHDSVEPWIESLTKKLPAAPQGVSDMDFVFGYEDEDGNHLEGLIDTSPDLKEYAESRPKEFEIVKKCLGISRSNSVHASAFLISDREISIDAPLLPNRSTQYEAKYVEKAGLIKYDFLVVNQLKDIEDCLIRINNKHAVALKTGLFLHEGKETFIWDLPLDDGVFRSVWNGETETLFQISTGAMSPFVKKIQPSSLEDLAAVLALVRPGTMDAMQEGTDRSMADEYVERRFGRSKMGLKELWDILPETYGVLLYQEEIQKISKVVGGLSGNDAENLRRAMSKKNKVEVGKFKGLFIQGAKTKVSEAAAEEIWAQMETSSRYSFNYSHAQAYSMITYAGMFLKHHYPLEWWASIVSNATEEEITNKLFKHISTIVTPPDINLSTEKMEIDYKNGKIRSKLSVLRGLGDKSIEKIVENRPYSDINDFVRKEVVGPALAKKLIHVGVMDTLFDSSATPYDKMKAYEDAIELNNYEKKVASGVKAVLKEGAVDPEFIGISPLDDFCIRKAIMPTSNMNLSKLILEEAERINEGSQTQAMYSDCRGAPVKFLEGQKLKELEAWNHQWEVKYCFAAYVVDAVEKPYAKNTRKRLILILDIDGEISERILWPDYNSGVLTYPAALKKGSIAFFFWKTKKDKDPSLYDIVIEKEARLSKQKKRATI